MRLALSSATLAVAALAGSLAIAQDGPTPEQQAVNARHSHMQLYAFNLGALGGMAQGAIPYDAEIATSAAQNLVNLAGINQNRYWPEGTSSEDMEESHALPALWDNMADYEAKHDALDQAAAALLQAAGTDQATLAAAMGAVGQACGACHESYREPQG